VSAAPSRLRSPGNLGYGGNTACIAVRLASHPLLVLDAGTGIRSLGDTIATGEPLNLFLTHFHWDHIQGIPSFAPIQNATIYSSAEPADLERILVVCVTHFDH
jgi:phosphoribosyl 1,2-cyclic phosphodiesterase